MTKEEKIKEVMELVRKYGSHLDVAGGFAGYEDLRGVEESHREKARMNRDKIESKLRELIKDE